jgi:hypothetical protein
LFQTNATNTTKDIHILISRTCGQNAGHAKGDLADPRAVVRVSWIGKKAQSDFMSPQKQRTLFPAGSEKSRALTQEGFHPPLLALKREEKATSTLGSSEEEVQSTPASPGRPTPDF